MPEMSETSIRIISAVLMGSAVLVFTFVGGWTFAALVSFVSLIMVWEWGGIVRKESWDAVTCFHGIIAVLSILIVQSHYSGALVVLVAMLTVGMFITAFFVRYDENRVWSLLGLIYVLLPAISLVYLRQLGEHGLIVILFIFCIVWTTDTAAYFTGRCFGGPKFWPKVSPKKTWSGVTGGMVGSVCVALLFAWFINVSSSGLATIALLLAIAVILGDLFESALKRRFSVKDSSTLIPGHGGVLDRVDGLVFAVVLAAIIAVVIGTQIPVGGVMLSSLGL